MDYLFICFAFFSFATGCVLVIESAPHKDVNDISEQLRLGRKWWCFNIVPFFLSLAKGGSNALILITEHQLLPSRSVVNFLNVITGFKESCMSWFEIRSTIGKWQLCICLQVSRQNQTSWPFKRPHYCHRLRPDNDSAGDEERAPSKAKSPTRS